jgi:hypothetical protein
MRTSLIYLICRWSVVGLISKYWHCLVAREFRSPSWQTLILFICDWRDHFLRKRLVKATMKCGSYTLALVGSRQVKRDEERVKTHGEETVLEGKANYAQCHVPPLFYGAGLERA